MRGEAAKSGKTQNGATINIFMPYERGGPPNPFKDSNQKHRINMEKKS